MAPKAAPSEAAWREISLADYSSQCSIIFFIPFLTCVVDLALRPRPPVGFLTSAYTNNTVDLRSQFPLAVMAVCFWSCLPADGAAMSV